jgi:hypothetical protein
MRNKNNKRFCKWIRYRIGQVHRKSLPVAGMNSSPIATRVQPCNCLFSCKLSCIEPCSCPSASDGTHAVQSVHPHPSSIMVGALLSLRMANLKPILRHDVVQDLAVSSHRLNGACELRVEMGYLMGILGVYQERS